MAPAHHGEGDDFAARLGAITAATPDAPAAGGGGSDEAAGGEEEEKEEDEDEDEAEVIVQGDYNL